ncbi:DNA polymerase III subunit alpha [Candidatus Woesebacteria bacterium RIFOXYB1_FULL_38_16]|uniref:DNA polymerase III subunit alpha n=1 Tax=Candidatus Woesebacteria bacterium RIFOXYB1_FULL_38_16 TaxID=1802538 RepID=A0A1F8CUY1_9BACT|nr:MAG: DNA polymerase III subunit alpha [Candidatus Woesebacteria bacterium RIFOXYB1_FULL_38_16]
MKSKFVHLHVHTEYSLLDGLSNIKKLINHIKENGMDSVAITDHGAMYGVIDFYKQAKNAEIKPILGMEGYLTNIDHTIRGERKKMKNFHLLLLAKNLEGYKNLMKLTSIAHTEGYYYRPRFDHKTLKKYAKGIICTSGCMQGEIPQALLNGGYDEAKKRAEWFLDLFGDDFYFEIQRHGYDKHAINAINGEIKQELLDQAVAEKTINEGIIKLSRDLGVPVIATNDAHYVNVEDAVAQDALVCIATGKTVSETKRLRFIDAPSYFVTTPDEMSELFSDLPDALSNTLKVAEKCDIELTLGKFFFPKIDLPEGVEAKDELIRIADEGLIWRYGEKTKELTERLEYELGIINDKGYAAYFLIYRDMAKWSIERRVPINVRGSVAGSIVSYVLGITTVDPIRFNLPFERFLNPYRPSAPDIDLDIADDKRGEMIAYLVEKYGRDKVAQICTFGRMLAKGSVRDVARVLGYPYEVGDRVSKLIPMGVQGFPMTIKRALEDSAELAELYKSDSDSKKIIDLAKQIEGSVRHVSVHAGGVVIAPSDLNDFVPLQFDTSDEKKLITQYEMHACEDVGLVKLDILGIRNLSILRESVEKVRETSNAVVDLAKIPLDDKKTFEMLSRGETMGVFQLSGSGMTRYLVDMQPTQIEDIMMMIALFRPGPMKNIDEYIARKKGIKKVTYYHPKMEKFLQKSLGVLVYQDDLLYTALEVAGYNWEEVDKFRKAVGKKIPEEMARQHLIFVEGCIKNSNMSEKEAEGLWALFEPFQGYGFNKAHSASYGMVAYQTAYMKATYPVEYMTALLTAESGDKDKISAAVNECRRIGIVVLPPDINESEVGFTIVKNKESLGGKGIRFGLSAIKNVGVSAIEAILEARKIGKFMTIQDFCSRVDSRKANKRVFESLIKVGAMSKFGNRASLLASVDEIRAKIKPKIDLKQQGLFSAKEEEKMVFGRGEMKIVVEVPELPLDEIEILERQLLGFSISAKPLNEMISDLISYGTHKVDELLSEHVVPSGEVKIACVVSSVRVVVTKRTGAEMAFVKVIDETGALNTVVFPKIYKETKLYWMENTPLLLTGKIEHRDDGVSMIVNLVETVQMVKEKEGSLKITIPKGVSREALMRLRKLLVENPGNKNVILFFEDGGKDLLLDFKIHWGEELARKIANELNMS